MRFSFLKILHEIPKALICPTKCPTSGPQTPKIDSFINTEAKKADFYPAFSSLLRAFASDFSRFFFSLPFPFSPPPIWVYNEEK
ncbi:hypothetical protein HMPREF0262_01364 [Clostridium sp. ATCC 29733]|nr:hypothetical protein HMPREF0262_01364 [Clostridium sp. ATCC 29733]